MKKLLFLPCALVLVGCASYYDDNNRASVDPYGSVVYEPSGAQNDPNPNWDVNARDIRQRPYGAMMPWWGGGANRSTVAPSTDTEKSIAPQSRPEGAVP
jgi:hypothetical protein